MLMEERELKRAAPVEGVDGLLFIGALYIIHIYYKSRRWRGLNNNIASTLYVYTQSGYSKLLYVHLGLYTYIANEST